MVITLFPCPPNTVNTVAVPLFVVFLLVSFECATVAYQEAFTSLTRRPAAASALHPSATQRAPESPMQETNDRYARQMMESIAGREKEPAGTVFRNIQIPWFKDVPAENLIGGRSFGVRRQRDSEALPGVLATPLPPARSRVTGRPGFSYCPSRTFFIGTAE